AVATSGSLVSPQLGAQASRLRPRAVATSGSLVSPTASCWVRKRAACDHGKKVRGRLAVATSEPLVSPQLGAQARRLRPRQDGAPDVPLAAAQSPPYCSPPSGCRAGVRPLQWALP